MPFKSLFGDGRPKVKKTGDINLPNERPVSPNDPRWKQFRARKADQTINRLRQFGEKVKGVTKGMR